ncbi:hypothetical protein WMF38_57485 [Sorangium sp. So ce118]
MSEAIYGIAVYASVATLKARPGPRLEKHVYVRENRKLYRWIPGNADEDDSDSDADTLAATGGDSGRWKTIGVIPAQADDVEELTDSTSGTAGNTITNVGASFSQATLNNNFATLTQQLNDIRAALRSAGVMT